MYRIEFVAEVHAMWSKWLEDWINSGFEQIVQSPQDTQAKRNDRDLVVMLTWLVCAIPWESI